LIEYFNVLPKIKTISFSLLLSFNDNELNGLSAFTILSIILPKYILAFIKSSI